MLRWSPLLDTCGTVILLCEMSSWPKRKRTARSLRLCQRVSGLRGILDGFLEVGKGQRPSGVRCSAKERGCPVGTLEPLVTESCTSWVAAN